jgi:hypothetical protein
VLPIPGSKDFPLHLKLFDLREVLPNNSHFDIQTRPGNAGVDPEYLATSLAKVRETAVLARPTTAAARFADRDL